MSRRNQLRTIKTLATGCACLVMLPVMIGVLYLVWSLVQDPFR